MPRRILDISRTLSRAGRLTPDAIDRVERAWLRHLRPDPEARFLIAAGGGHALLDGRGAAELVEGLASGEELPPADLRGAFSRWRTERQRRADSVARRLSLAQAEDLAALLSADAAPKTYLNVSQTHFDAGRLKTLREGGVVRAVVMAHDVLPLEHPELAPHSAATRRMDFLAAAGLADGVVWTQEGLAARAAPYMGRTPPGCVAPLGLTPLPDAPAAPSDAPHFVMLGSIAPRNNQLGMLWIWRRLHDELGDAAPRLHIVGRRGTGDGSALDLLDRAPMMGRAVFAHRDLPDAQTAALLRSARALLAPAFAATTGTAVGEALALGTPVIAADLPEFRAIAGDAAEYLDPLDLPAWIEAALGYADDRSEARDRQIDRIAAWRAPSWEAHFAEAERFLETLETSAQPA